MEVKPVLAVDFGTSNTYVTKSLGDKEDPVGVDFGDGRDGIATAILYRNGKDPVIGNVALDEFGDAVEERRDYTIRAQFKPDVADSAEARQYACDFLASLLVVARKQHKDLDPLRRQVIFGVPSEASAEYREAIRSIAWDAGFGAIKTVDEPKGAIFFHIQRKDITPAEALKGALVVDFGGGTCDFALVVRGEVLHSWGDMQLGGRLFDDLFYQWFVEQNPDAPDDMRRERAEFFVLAVRCREIKEKFSLAMALDPSKTFRKSVGEFGRISDMTWDGFLKRAGRYQPSDVLAQYLRAMNPNAYKTLFAPGRSLDLLDWFRQALRKGLEHERVHNQDLACVILTGGSSSWPFAVNIVNEEMARWKRSPRVVHSDRPYVTISQGLSIIPAFQARLENIQRLLRETLPNFLADEINPLIDRRIAEAAERIAELVAQGLFDKGIGPILFRFREEGGSVASLKIKIAYQAAAFKTEIESIVKKQMAQVVPGLSAGATELMHAWYRKYGLTVDRGLGHEGIRLDHGNELRIGDLDVYGGIGDVIVAVSTTIAAIIVATICGGAGTAIIASGPLGWLIGAVIGVVAGALAAVYGVEEAKRRAENWDGIPIWVIRNALSEEKIIGVRNDIKAQIASAVTSQTDAAKQGLEQAISHRVVQEIDNISAISQF